MLTARVRFNRRLKDLLGRAAGIGGVYRRRFRSHMKIVAFHRVTDELAEDGLTCSAAGFEAFCRFFARHFRSCRFPNSSPLAAIRV